mmetsp:Transcript_48822/g.126712  ORF Transcript_48822/g.126712 Transcript_48822/m.126712 type:complete len:266 (+) Transcript_48822:68-865(+)
MTDISPEQMLAATASLRAEAVAKEKGLEYEEKDRDTDMSIGEAIDDISNTMQKDKFWADLATPILSAREELSQKAWNRERAVALLQHACDQIDEIKHYFKAEHSVVQSIIEKLLIEPPPETPLHEVLDGVRRTSDPDTRSKKEKAKQEYMQRKAANAMKEMPRPGEPWLFEERQDKTDVTVTIAVPAETKASDVRVVFKETHLLVAVQGHALQPTVCEGELAGGIDPDSCGWTLEGSGENRKLVLEMERTMGGIDWHRLFKNPRH